MEYMIKMICANLGVIPDTLRKWEMRYRIVSPRRINNRYRLYNEEDVEKLYLFKQKCSSGMSANQAAADVKKTYHVSTQRDTRIQKRAWEAIKLSNQPAIKYIFMQLIKSHGLVNAFQRVWFPVLVKLGECGMSHESIWIAREHFAISYLRMLLLKHTHIPKRKFNSLVALTSPEGEYHELGMLAAAAALWQKKISNIYLGPNMPLESLCRIMQNIRVRHLCITMTNTVSRSSFKGMVKNLKRGMPGMNLYFAGQGTFPHAKLIQESGAVFLGTHMRIGLDILSKKINQK